MDMNRLFAGEGKYAMGLRGACCDRKSQAALALAVSLWIANGGVALAENKTVWTETTIEGDESANAYYLGGNNVAAPKGTGIKFTVENGGKVQSISGNSPGNAQSSGNTVIVKEGGKVGPDTDAIIGGLSNNEVSIEGTVTGRVYGGKNISGISTGNHVVVKGTVGVVYGGYGATATNNTVEILGGHAGSVCGGGYGSTTTNNNVVLKNATVDETVWGGFSEVDVTGNTLTISGKNTVGGIVGRLQTIKLASDLEWDSTNAVLTAGDYIRGSFESSIALDISEAAALKNHTESGTMTLIKATNDDANLNGTRFTLSGTAITAEGVTVKNEAKTSGANGVTIGYNNIHTVDLVNENKAITYTVANSPVKNITLGSIAWNDGGTARTLTDEEQALYTFDADTAIDASNLTFTGKATTALKTDGTSTMTLLAGATNITGNHITQPTAGKGQVAVEYTDTTGIKFDATATGAVSAATDSVKYTVSGVTLNSVNLATWNGTTSTVPDGWTGASVPVNTGFFSLPNETTTILTATTENFFGEVTGTRAYTIDSNTPFAKYGITMSHYKVSGVKAEAYNGLANAKLTYYASTDIATRVTLGEIAWNTSAPAWSDSKYTFNADTVIDASNLTFSGTATTALKTDGTSKMTLLSGVTGGENVLSANITQPSEGKGTLAVDYTNNENINFTAAASGEVTVDTNKVDYTINNVTLSGVDLADWNGTSSTVPDGWTAKTDGVSVTGDGLAAPSITTGNSVDILTAGTDGYFSDANISDAIEFKEYAGVSDTAKGVTLIGDESKGVKAASDGKSLIYERDFTVNEIALGSVKWDDGRALSGTVFNFDQLGTVDATKLSFKFTDEQKKALAAGSTTVLLSNANGLPSPGGMAGKVTYKDSADHHTQAVDLTAANGSALTGSLEGTFTYSDNDNISFKVNSMNLDAVDLSSWDSTKNADEVPSGWAPKSGGVSVTADSNFAPSIDAGTSKNILTATDGFFTNANISDAIKYKAGAESSDTANGVTLTGAESKGVKASDDGKNLVYARSKFIVNDITLGTITWNKEGTARELTAGDYTFNDSTAIDTSGFEFNTPSYIGAGDSMTLISNATGLTAGDSIAHSQSYTNYDNCIKLNATLTGSITRTADTLGYTAIGTTLDSVDLANWNGMTTAVPAGWTSNLGENSIKAAGFTAPTIDAGASQNIITTNTTNFFSDDKITGALKYGQSVSTDNDKGVWFTGFESKGVKASDDGKKLIYARSNFNVRNIRLGEMTWGTPREATTSYDFANVGTINAENLEFTNPDAVTGSGTLLTGAANLATGASIAHTQNFVKDVNGATLYATLSGNVTRETAEQIGYTATGTTLDSISLTGWNGTEGSIPTGWTSALGNNSITAVSVDGSGVAPGNEQNILTSGTENFFNDNQITDALKYKAYASKSETLSGVTLTGSESKGVKASTDGKNLVYARSDKNVSNISFGTMKWGMSLTADYGYNYTNANIDLSKLTFSNPENISAGGTTTLLVANNTLAAIGETVKSVSYEYSPVAGVTVNGTVNGSYMTTNVPALQYTATENKADKLTFGNVEWKDTGALMERPANITFAGAAVDTSNINFTNISELEANKEMTLVGNFGDTVGTITGTKYMVGSTLQGEGKASLEGSNLIFRTDTTAEKMEVQEQTHNTVMSEEVAIEALGAGDDFIAAAEDGLGHASNVGADGIASFATMGGGSIRQETGSHVDTRTWNAIIALGHKNEKEKCSFEYGAFFEYGRGNYTTYNGDQRGDGSTYYTGGGLLAKWQKKDGTYVEGSLRAGNVHDDAKNVLRDAMGNPYSYETDAPYWGVHVGVGKVIQLNESSELDVYGKFFHNHRNSVSFDAGGHYDLDAVNSDVLRLGTRYVMKREKWNFYGGLAYEQEFSGKAEGTADGMAIRGADTSGGSLRAELGAVLNPKKDGPITLDFNLSGFAGKKRGLTGGVAVTFNF